MPAMVLTPSERGTVRALRDVLQGPPKAGRAVVRIADGAVNCLDIRVAENVVHADQARSLLLPGYDVGGRTRVDAYRRRQRPGRDAE